MMYRFSQLAHETHLSVLVIDKGTVAFYIRYTHVTARAIFCLLHSWLYSYHESSTSRCGATNGEDYLSFEPLPIAFDSKIGYFFVPFRGVRSFADFPLPGKSVTIAAVIIRLNYCLCSVMR